MFLHHLKLTLLLFFLCTFVLRVEAQQAQDRFGKNRIQYKDFNWKYISTFNFDIYYYEGGKDLATAAGNYAEADFHKIVEKTGFTPYSKIKILIYNTGTELQQSNIGLEDGTLLIGGQTHFVKSKMEVAFKGSQSQFRKDISFGVAQMIINLMLYGGSLKDIVQSSYLLALPEWYVNGAAAFIAEGWSVSMDNAVRDLVSRRDFKKLSLLSGDEALIAGQSIWNYIQEKYGKGNLANILNLTRIVRNEEASIESSLGIPYYLFIKEWKAYYSGMRESLKGEYGLPEKESTIIKNKKDYNLRNISVSPDGKWVSFVQAHKGKYQLVAYDIENRKKKVIHKDGHLLLHQEEDPNVIVSAWKAPALITYIENRKNKIYMTAIDLGKGKKVRRYLKDFRQVLSYSFSKDGDYAIISGDKNGQADIFLYDYNDNAVKQLTNDLYDDLWPSFIGGSYSVAFSSNRKNDTLKKDLPDFKDIRQEYNLFVYNVLAGNKDVLRRLTEYGSNTRPVSISDNELLFLSDEKGISNLYKCNLSTSEISQLTAYFSGIADYDLREGLFAFILLNNGKEQVYLKTDMSLSGNYYPHPTLRQRHLLELYPRKDSVSKVVAGDTASSTEVKEIDINNYQFESDVKKSKKSSNLFFGSKPAVKKDEIKFKGPYTYRNLFGIERVNSTVMIDPFRGLGILMEVNMADMMGNHRLNGGIFGLSDLKSSNVFGEYLYLKNRVDFGLRFDRKTFYAYNESVTQRYTLNRMAATASYPLSTSARISLSPFVAATRYSELSNILSADKTALYGGLRGEYIFDNTVTTGLNMIQGTRGKVVLEQYVSGKQRNFGKFVVDFRHYHRIHKNLIFATRGSYGQFLGPAKKNFLLGGMDNWLLNQVAHPGGNDPLALAGGKDNSDLLFVEYVTNMRGFSYNTQYGSKYLLFNAEIRMPLFKYFYNGVINSNFLKNFQLTGFTDIGSSWTGSNPFSRNNSTNTTHVGGGSSPFSATVINFKNPFLIGYGAGVRTLFLGYYVKFDVAWGLLDNQVQPRRYYLTFGYDF